MRRIARRPAICRPAPWVGTPEDWQTGLEAAAQLRATFPDFWAQHVAGRRVTLGGLLTAGRALIALAPQVVELTDMAADAYWRWADGDPAETLDADPDDTTMNGEPPWELLADFVARPPVMVYGLDVHTDEGELENFGALAAAFTWMTDHLPVGDEDLGAVMGLDATGGLSGPPLDVYHVITGELPRIALERGNLHLLLAALGETAVAGIATPLGTLMAYAHQRTGNFFADTGYWEADDMRAYGAWQPTDNHGNDLRAMGEAQAEARAIVHDFQRLQDRILGRPSGLLEIAQAVITAAEELGLTVRWPGDEEADAAAEDDNPEDLEDEGNDDDDFFDNDEAPALAAA